MRSLARVSWLLVLALIAAACERAPSKLDEVRPSTSPPPLPGAEEPLGDLETRVARLEATLRAREDALRWLDAAYAQRVEAEARGGGQAQAPAPPARPQGPAVVDIQQNLALGMIEGPDDAPVTIVEAWDFACPHCYRASLMLSETVAEYAGKVRVVMKNMVVHPNEVLKAHLAGCAAGKQGKFLAFYKAFWDRGYREYFDRRDPSFLGEDNVYRIAGEVGLDVERLKADLGACQAVIQADQSELRRNGVTGTPAFFINGELVGGLPRDGLKRYIDAKLGR